MTRLAVRINPKLVLRRLLSETIGIEVESAKTFDLFLSLLRRQIHRSKNFFFVQIGANDGIRYDPIYPIVQRYELCGLVVEPLPDHFAELEKNYRNCPGVTPVNVAIHASETEVPMYRIDPTIEGAPDWAPGIASFDPNHHKKSDTPADWIIEEKVHCVTLQQLLSDHGVSHVDLLQIDTEGYDAEIIRMVDFTHAAPTLIRFEHSLTEGVMSPGDFVDIIQLLKSHGYNVLVEEYDAVAYRRDW